MTLVVGMYAAGAAAAAACLFLPPPRDVLSATVFLVLAFFVAGKRVKIQPQVASISLGFVLVFAALFRCGTLVAMAAAVTNTLACYVLRDRNERQPSLFALAYNVAALVVAAYAAGALHTYLLPGAALAGIPWPEVWAAAAAVLAYHALSVMALGLVSTLCRMELDVRRWWGELLATAPIYLAGGALALALDEAIVHAGRWVFILGLPFAYIIHRTYQVQAQKVGNELRLLHERVAAGEKMARLYLSVVEALSNAIEVKDHGTLEHVRRVHGLAREVAERLGMTGDDLEAVKIGAVLHDIGKLAVPDYILRKPGRLTEEEFNLVRGHAAAGEAILRPIDFGVPVASIIRHHHEKLDGSGYPDGLCGDEISLGSRVLAVIDVYDALVSDRPYRKAWTTEMALEHLRKEAGTSFDPAVVDALAGVLEAHPPDPGPACEEVSLQTETGPPEPTEPPLDETAAARITEEARRHVLQGLADQAATRHRLLAAVAYDANHRTAELDAVAATGSCAGAFNLLRLPFDWGASGRAGCRGAAETGPAPEDFAGCVGGVPAGLRGASVTAMPVLDGRGATVAVLSLYHAERDGLNGPQADEGLRAIVSLAGRQLELLAGGDGAPQPPVVWHTHRSALEEIVAGGT
jgi:putative nucleotidyltransferase with HDIG domain